MARQKKLEVRGYGRGGNQRSIKSMLKSKELVVYFNRTPTDDELRRLSVASVDAALAGEMAGS